MTIEIDNLTEGMILDRNVNIITDLKGNKILVEASPYDGIWGIKMAETDKMAQNPLKWNGFNLLGFALMEVRDVLSEVCRNEQLVTLN